MDIEETPSPFIEGTNIQFAWDSTSLGWAKTCPRLYYYSMVYGYRGKEESIHLRFGIEYHEALRFYDESRANGIDHDTAVHDTVRVLLARNHEYPIIDEEAKPSIRAKSKENLFRTFIWYLDIFKNDTAKTYIKNNGDPAVEQNFKFMADFGPQVGNDPYIICGYLDRIVDYQGETFVMDRKTTYSTPGSYYFDRYEPDNQMSLYTLAGQIILGAPVKGVIIDVAQVAIEFSRFVRGFTYRTQDQLDEWRRDLRITLNHMEEYALEGYWPQNDTACDKYGGCKFREVCSKSPSVREAFLKSDFKREPWNPLVTR